MAKSFGICLFAAVLMGCSSQPAPSTAPVATESAAQPPISQTADKVPVSPAEVKAVLDLEEYPGSELVENWRLESPTLSPDEARFELVRRSTDPPSKVVAYYEKALGEKATGQSGHQEIFGRTQRGNFVRAHVDAEGTGSKFSLNIISYKR